MTLLRRLPVDLIAFVVIAIVVVVTRLPFLHRGIVFADPAWFFHFGNRIVHGDVPYRDFVFQVGPLPIYLDALFQRVFGEVYLSSLYAELFIHVLRVWMTWMLARRLAGNLPAGLVCVWFAFDQYLGPSYHWSYPYAELLMVQSALFCVLALRAPTERRTLIYLALAGLSAGLIVAARQATVVTVGCVLIASSTILLVRKDWFTPKRFAALWAGFVGAFVIVFGLLACAGTLGPAIQQIFLDAPQKKSASGLTSVADALSGGSAVLYGVPWWKGMLHFLLLPIIMVALTMRLVARGDRPIELRTVAQLAMPIAVVIGLALRYGELFYFADVPRCFFSVTTALAVLAPDRLRRWFGMEPLVAIALGGLPLASDWALEMSYPGRGWGEWAGLGTGIVLFAFAAPRLARSLKIGLAAAIACAGVIYPAVYLDTNRNPFTVDMASDGSLDETVFESDAPVLRGTQISESRMMSLAWLEGYVTPGATCFHYGSLPIIYDVLRCKNPTRIDTTIADFITADDARAAIAILEKQPPDFIIAQELSFTNPPLSYDFEGKIEYYSPVNSDAAKVMYLGLRHMIVKQYDDLGLVSDVIGPELTKQAWGHWDLHQLIRLYRRKK